jgi:putative ABC transport system ATP-binding protein
MLRGIRSRREDFATLRMARRNPIVLSVRNLTKTYRSAGEQIEVLRGVNLSIAAGERVALTGESGSGKSTVLHLIAGLDRPDGGDIRLGIRLNC